MKNRKWYLKLFGVLLGVFCPILLLGDDLKQCEDENNRSINISIASSSDLKDEENHFLLSFWNLLQCSRCAGSGYTPNGNRPCSRCNAKGVVPTGRMQRVSCPTCSGSGTQRSQGKCIRCKGRGYQAVLKTCKSCRGTKKILSFGRYTTCYACSGSGKKLVNQNCSACRRGSTGVTTCSTCGGKRTILSPETEECPQCDGAKYGCPKCGGDGKV